MDPRRVLTFRAVARHRSFTMAAQELALTQPSVSNQVAALEREVGARLLDRRPGGLRLTRAGEVLLDHANAIAERFDLAGLQLAEIAEDERTRLRIGAFPTALAGLVPAAVAGMRAQHPDARVTVDEVTPGDLPEHVLSGRVHLGVGFDEARHAPRETGGAERVHLLREPFRVALPPHHRLATRPAVRLADLAGEDWLAAYTDGLIVRACRAAGFEPRLVSVTRDQLAIRALIIAGLAVTLAPALLADAFRGTALRPIAGDAPEREVYALLPPGRRHPLAPPTLSALAETARGLMHGPG
jgi:DNA-binding transcriptional LysR family regulator